MIHASKQGSISLLLLHEWKCAMAARIVKGFKFTVPRPKNDVRQASIITADVVAGFFKSQAMRDKNPAAGEDSSFPAEM